MGYIYYDGLLVAILAYSSAIAVEKNRVKICTKMTFMHI